MPSLRGQIFEIASMHLGTCGHDRLRSRIRASKTEHLMARVDEVRNNNRTDKAGSTGDKNAHYEFSFSSFRNNVTAFAVTLLRGASY